MELYVYFIIIELNWIYGKLVKVVFHVGLKFNVYMPTSCCPHLDVIDLKKEEFIIIWFNNSWATFSSFLVMMMIISFSSLNHLNDFCFIFVARINEIIMNNNNKKKASIIVYFYNIFFSPSLHHSIFISFHSHFLDLYYFDHHHLWDIECVWNVFTSLSYIPFLSSINTNFSWQLEK